MGCTSTYLVSDGSTSQLYKDLTDRYGQVQGESMYLNSKLYDWKQNELNPQGEPTIEAMLYSNPQMQKMTPSDIKDNLISAAANLDFNEERHEYSVDGKMLDSTSRRIDKYVPYTGSKTEYNYAEQGTRYHRMFELVVQGHSISKITEMTDANKAERELIKKIKKFIERFPSDYILMPEYKLADTKRGVAGTIDLLVIKPNGKADIYDLKTVFETPGRKHELDIWNVYASSYDAKGNPVPNYKARRYALQTLYYKDLAQTSDPATSRLGVEVENVYVVPIEVLGEPDNWTDFNIRPVDNVANWQSGSVNFAIEAEQLIREDKATTKLSNIQLKAAKVESSPDDFVNTIIGKTSMSPKQLRTYSSNIVEQYSDKPTFRYKGTDYKWASQSKIKRISQVKQIMLSEDKVSDKEMVRSAVTTLKTKRRDGVFLRDDDIYHQLRQIYKMSNAVNSFALSDISGFENDGDILVLQRANGTIELVKMTYDNLTYRIETTHKEIATDKNTIAGNHLTFNQANSKGIKLQNTMEDREKLRLALIAMKLKETNPDMKVDRILVSSYSGKVRTTPAFVLLNEILPQVKALSEIDAVKTALPTGTKNMIANDELYVPASYETDSVTELLNYFDSQLIEDDFIGEEGKKNVRYYMRDKLQKFIDEEITKDELLEYLYSREYGLRKILYEEAAKGLSQSEIEEAVQSNPEFIALSKAVLSLMEIKIYPEKDLSDYMFGKLNQFIVNPSKTGMKSLDAAMDFGRRVVDNVKKRIQTFNDEKIPVLEKLRADAGLLHQGIKTKRGKTVGPNSIVGMGTTAFEPLIQKRKTPDGKEYFIPFFIEEGTTQWNNLSTAQKNTIKWMNGQIEKSFRESHQAKNEDGSYVHHWPKGMIPISTSKPNDFLYKTKKEVGKGNLKGAAKMVRNSVKRSIDLATGQYEFRQPAKSNHRTKLGDYFIGQINSKSGTISQKAIETMGLDENFNLVDEEANNGFQLDLDTSVTSFVEHYAKKTEYDKALPGLMMFRSIFKMYENAYFLNQSGAIMNLDNWIEENMFGEKKVAINPTVDKATSVAIGVAGFSMFGLNWKTFTLNGIQGYGQTVIRSITSSMTKDKKFPGVRAFAAAHEEYMKALYDPNHARLLTMIADAYIPEDLIQLKSKKYKPLQTGMLSSQTAFAIDRGIERSLRILYIIAQMKKDGTFDAHSIGERKDEFGNTVYYLQYNEYLDDRFKKTPKLKDAIKKSLMEKEEGIDDTGKMTLAYDWRLRQRMKHYSDLITPSADKDLASAYRHYGMAGAVGFIRSWARDYVVKATTREYSAEITGDYTLTSDEKFAWTDDPFKGIWVTYLDTIKYMADSVRYGKNEFKNLSKEDKENLVFTGNSIVAWSLLGLLAMSIKNAFEDDPEKQKFADYAFGRMIDDVMVAITLGPVWGIVDDPFIFLSYYKRLWNTAGQAMADAATGDFDQSWESLQSITPIVKNFRI